MFGLKNHTKVVVVVVVVASFVQVLPARTHAQLVLEIRDVRGIL